jgi:DNA-binding CsgD family transcriptional regulator
LDPTGSHLAELFADAPLSAGGWDVAISALAGFTGAGRAHMIGFGGAKTLPFSRFVGMEALPVDFQVAAGAADPRQSWRLGSVGGLLEVVGESQYAALRGRAESDAYNGVCETADIPYGAQTILWSDGEAMVGLATFRGLREGPASLADEARFAQVAPHARMAVRMQRAIEFQGVSLTLGAIEAVSGAAFLLDRRGRVAQMSPAADVALREGWLRLSDQRLAGRTPTDDTALRTAIAQSLSGARPASERIWLVTTDDKDGRCWCEVYALPTREWATLFRPHVLVTFHRTVPIDLSKLETLRRATGLTPGEADVALRLANGMSRAAIAAARGSSPGTVAVQLKHILNKLGVRREAQLVAFINRLLRR